MTLARFAAAPVRRSTPRSRRTAHGFTLLELLVVIVIIGLLAGLVAPRYFDQVSKSNTKIARAQIDSLEKALDQYRLDVGSYPTTEQGLAALNTRPPNLDKWAGPYLKKAVPPDPWGARYRVQGARRPRRLRPVVVGVRWATGRHRRSCRRHVVGLVGDGDALRTGGAHGRRRRAQPAWSARTTPRRRAPARASRACRCSAARRAGSHAVRRKRLAGGPASRPRRRRGLARPGVAAGRGPVGHRRPAHAGRQRDARLPGARSCSTWRKACPKACRCRRRCRATPGASRRC